MLQYNSIYNEQIYWSSHWLWREEKQTVIQTNCVFGVTVLKLNVRSGKPGTWNTEPTPTSCCCALQVLEQWESQQGQSSPAQTSLSAPVIPHSAPYPTHHLHRASVPDSASEALALAKPEPFDLYEKSRAIYESRRKYQSRHRRWKPHRKKLYHSQAASMKRARWNDLTSFYQTELKSPHECLSFKKLCRHHSPPLVFAAANYSYYHNWSSLPTSQDTQTHTLWAHTVKWNISTNTPHSSSSFLMSVLSLSCWKKLSFSCNYIIRVYLCDRNCVFFVSVIQNFMSPHSAHL